jgi:transposase
VDVAKDWLDAHIRPAGVFQRFGNDAAGIADLAELCRGHGVGLVVMEASGGYERTAFLLLWELGVGCALANARSVRRFAEAMGFLEKTDRIDAGVIAWYAEVKRIVAQAPAGETQERLEAMVTRLRQLTELRTAQANQRRLLSDRAVLAAFEELLAFIARQIRHFERAIAELIEGDPLWKALDAAFRSIKGVADRTVARLMAELPEIGTLSGKAASKLVGLAPLARDSGKREGKRQVRGGRSGVRAVLFVVAEVVRRHQPDFAAFHKRLSQAGKPKKLIRIALAHKLLVRLNAKARDVRAKMTCPA